MSDENTDTANGDRKPEPGKVSIAKKQTTAGAFCAPSC